ncbi:transposase [Massilia sp. YMA4]|uniref:transposase n=1 Tax=Massilia sp. YMA4 TaxID=1593482 RepID=UPI000DD15CC3|nr:transposase [Massilia sp. YMA4]AXA92748.1 addiction module toxin RelE [Massilia sp. YMA4]
MTRPLRLEFPGACYHVTSRGDRREAIYRDDSDRLLWLDGLATVCQRFNFLVHAYCQMGNHYHLVVQTAEGNLSQGMRHLNGTYTQRFNRRHQLAGHLFQGRYHAVLVQRGSHLLELGRYVVLNPLRAGLVKSLDEWPWSSHPYVLGRYRAPAWLDVDGLLRQFGPERSRALQAYARFVTEGVGCASPLERAQHGLVLGDDDFVACHRTPVPGELLREVCKTQRRLFAMSLHQYEQEYPERDRAMAQAYRSTAYTMAQIAEHFDVSLKTVSRAVQRCEDAEARQMPGVAGE